MKLALHCSATGLFAVIRTLGVDTSRGLRRAREPGMSGNDLFDRLKSDIPDLDIIHSSGVCFDINMIKCHLKSGEQLLEMAPEL